jgi:hypothetical protein
MRWWWIAADRCPREIDNFVAGEIHVRAFVAGRRIGAVVELKRLPVMRMNWQLPSWMS